MQHPHPRGTVHGPEVWGQDDGECAKALSNLSNAIVFSGHSHTSLVDGKSVWQGAFTSVGCGSLRYIDSPGGRLYECRQGQLVTVYEDRIVLSRREFEADVPLGDDLVVRLPPRSSGFIGSGGRTENEWSRMT